MDKWLGYTPNNMMWDVPCCDDERIVQDVHIIPLEGERYRYRCLGCGLASEWGERFDLNGFVCRTSPGDGRKVDRPGQG